MRNNFGNKKDGGHSYNGISIDELVETWPPLITVQMAAATGLASERRIRRMCARGEIDSFKLGSEWRIHRDEFIEKYLMNY